MQVVLPVWLSTPRAGQPVGVTLELLLPEVAGQADAERGLGSTAGVADHLLTESLQRAFHPGNDPIFAEIGGSHATPAASAVYGPLRRGSSVMEA